MGTRTPWGTADSSKRVAVGIMQYSTPGHGGYHLTPKRNLHVRECWRRKDGWYEEDCEWAIVVITFQGLYDGPTLAQAISTAKNYYPDEFTIVTGLPVTLAESRVLRERADRETYKDTWIATTAWGDWHVDVPDGMVAVCCTLGGARQTSAFKPIERYALVPAAEYTPGMTTLGSIVDFTKHKEIERIVGCESKKRPA